MIRPHGHKRSAAVGNANIELWYRKTGLTRYEVDTQAFKDCMMTRGYRWCRRRRRWTRLSQNRPATVSSILIPE
jgi:hypothetical protein